MSAVVELLESNDGWCIIACRERGVGLVSITGAMTLRKDRFRPIPDSRFVEDASYLASGGEIDRLGPLTIDEIDALRPGSDGSNWRVVATWTAEKGVHFAKERHNDSNVEPGTAARWYLGIVRDA